MGTALHTQCTVNDTHNTTPTNTHNALQTHAHAHDTHTTPHHTTPTPHYTTLHHTHTTPHHTTHAVRTLQHLALQRCLPHDFFTLHRRSHKNSGSFSTSEQATTWHKQGGARQHTRSRKRNSCKEPLMSACIPISGTNSSEIGELNHPKRFQDTTN